MLKNVKGYLLLEMLLVTLFVSGVLMFLFVQIKTLSKSYDEYYNYNMTNDLFLLNNILKCYDENTLKSQLGSNNYVILYSSNNLNSSCKDLIELSNINFLILTSSEISDTTIHQLESASIDSDIVSFIKKINNQGEEEYRLVARFFSPIATLFNYRYATIRFGE